MLSGCRGHDDVPLGSVKLGEFLDFEELIPLEKGLCSMGLVA